MLPLLRLLPVGGVVLAILISILALTPPEGAMPALHRVAIDARGPLQNREDHPEWRQFIVMAAFRRAEAVTKLRDLPSAPTKLPEIVVPLPEPPPITMTAEPAPAPAVAMAPAPAIEDKPIELASLPLPEIEAPPITITPAEEPAVANTPATESASPPASPAGVGLPEALAAETRIAVPLPVPAPAELRKVAGVPVERSMTDPTPDEATGSIDAHPGSTIPVEIGEMSSTELPIVLPPERPPVLRKPKRPLNRAKHPVKPQPPRKQMGLLDVWLASRQATVSKAAKSTAQPQMQTQAQTGDSATTLSGN